MNQLRLLVALSPRPDYPDSPLDLKIGDVRYDLIVPAEASDLLVLHFHDAGGGYRRVARYCDADGIEAIRARPSLLDDAHPGVPTYADTAYGYEIDDGDGAVTGYVALPLAVGQNCLGQPRR